MTDVSTKMPPGVGGLWAANEAEGGKDRPKPKSEPGAPAALGGDETPKDGEKSDA